MDLFERNYQQLRDSSSPLAARMRPRTLEEFIGQEEIIGSGKIAPSSHPSRSIDLYSSSTAHPAPAKPPSLKLLPTPPRPTLLPSMPF